MNSFAKAALLLLAVSSQATTAEPVFTRVTAFTNTDTQSSSDGTQKSLNDYDPICKNDNQCEAMTRTAEPTNADGSPIYGGICEKCYAASTTHPFDECEDAPLCVGAMCSEVACEEFEAYCDKDGNDDDDDGKGECKLRAKTPSAASKDDATNNKRDSADDADNSNDGPVKIVTDDSNDGPVLSLGLRGTNSNSQCLGKGHSGNPEKYSPKRDGKSYNFNIYSKNAECRDSNNKAYEWGEYKNVNSATDCADVCVKAPESSIVTGGTFRGFEYICSAKQCRCLYDAGTLNSTKKTSSYNRTKTNQSGKGSIKNSQQKTDYYCAKLVGSATLEMAIE